MISVCLAFVKVSHLCLPQLSNLFIQRSFLPLKIQKRTITRFLGVQHLPQSINVLLKSRTTWSTGPSWKNTRLDSHQDFIHFQPPIMKCKRENMPFLHRCKPLFHDHLSCQNETNIIRYKEYERERRLRLRQRRIEEKAAKAQAENLAEWKIRFWRKWTFCA